ncbi:hypothetical protein F9949_11250 [Bacteroides stercoris]|uniref:Uncharacterized protein n=1 Tax=Bacteroides stercoris TaxID=46506 RepID=A0A412T4K1_BACSE|nr:hypothetical protein F9952_09900 [Bacteroides stercoris]KAB5317726.1 hypothetical protein F9949_11250 [Bacteroides stercoris]KAB5328636.1 hypothetical protein F9950_07000 [Bacteroides stercoris]KAB5333648.1 hypothetical protein F9944_11175 [Bacteroides stercoris]KAB5334846.1 hypothetical protein F9956_06575 [Bacteroides stercoris]
MAVFFVFNTRFAQVNVNFDIVNFDKSADRFDIYLDEKKGSTDFPGWQASYLSRQILTAFIPFAPRSRSNVTILPSLTSVTTLFT